MKTMSTIGRPLWLAAGVTAFVLIAVVPVLASGAYRPPIYSGGSSSGLSRQEVERGQSLFIGKEPIGTAGRTCLSCHDTGTSNPLRRSSLKQNSGRLNALVEQCLVAPDRCAVASGSRPSELTPALVAYLVTKYSLPREAVARPPQQP